MKEIISVICGVLIFFVLLFCAIEYEHDSKMECAKFAMEKQYTASDISVICFK